MQYSIDDVANLAKISIRTLHYYDEIGLLIPQDRLANGKRFYSEEELLKLMDIIFFKKIGFSLKKIQAMLSLGNQDKRALLIAKKEFLNKEILRIQESIKTIDLTLDFYYKGQNFNYSQLIKQFDSFQKTAKEDKDQFLKEFGPLEDEEAHKLKKMSVKEQQKYFQDMILQLDTKKYSEELIELFKELVLAIENNLSEDSKEVQTLMKNYHKMLKALKPISKKKWLSIGISISENKELFSMYSKMHPKLPQFLAKAIKIYANNITE